MLNNVYVGIIENRLDPLKKGRCQVRLFGIHTPDKTELPTSDLPWALPMQSINSAATSGKGTSPVGPLHGTWVMCIFMDGEDMQQPIMIGTIGGGGSLPDSSANTNEDTSAGVSTPIPDYGTHDSSETPVSTDKFPQPSGWKLGQTSRKNESGSGGPGTINNYANSGDNGGASYGSYQFASYLPPTMPSGRSRKPAINSPLVQYIRNSKFESQFAGLSPATPAFDAKWKEVAAKNPKEFADDQHDYIKKSHYDVLLGKLKRLGIDLTGKGAGVQDLVWSTAVHVGPSSTSVFTNPLKGQSNLDDQTIINLVSDYKIANASKLFSSSDAKTQASVQKRFKSERNDLLALSGAYPTTKMASINPDTASVEKPVANYTLKDDKINQQTITTTQVGYTDPDGVYPTKDYDSHPDTNKLATGVTKGTAVEDKINKRAVGLPLPNGNAFSQPASTYAAHYPYNLVHESESGHVIEIDDTPGAERIHVYHNTGTFIEIDAVGNIVKKSVGSSYDITEKNGYLYVEGQGNISVGGSLNIMVGADANIEVGGNTTLSCANDIIAEAGGRFQITAAEAIDMRSDKIYIEADTELHITAGTKMNLATPLFNLKVDNTINIQSLGISNIKTDTMNILSTNTMNIKSSSDFKIESGGITSIKAGADVNIDGSNTYIQSGHSVSAAAATDAEIAAFSQAGQLDGRTPYEEVLLDDPVALGRADKAALDCETPEDGSNGGYEAHKQALIDSGVATSSDFAKEAVEDMRDGDAKVVNPSTKLDTKFIEGLATIPGNLRLSPNFTIADLSSNAAVSKDKIVAQSGLTEQQIAANLYRLAINVLEPIKQKFPNMFVTSGFRSAIKNKNPRSQHPMGLCADLQFRGVTKSEYYNIAMQIKTLVPYDQLLLEYCAYSANPWIHISFSGDSNRGQILTLYNNKTHGQGLIKLA